MRAVSVVEVFLLQVCVAVVAMLGALGALVALIQAVVSR
jgi:hypothetical protein